MTNTSTQTSASKLLALIHETKAVSIWNKDKGPVFWYAAGVPGPFYVNTELVIGPTLSEALLQSINAILTSSNDPAKRADALKKIMLDAYQKEASYRLVIDALIEKAKSEFLPLKPSLVSGGERRDWLFSIPLAHELGLCHAYLFKNLSCYVAGGFQADEKVFHVADLINNAASYFDLWLPALTKAGLDYKGTLSVNIRGDNGLKRLLDHGQKVTTLNTIDRSFFDLWFQQGLITKDILDELTCFLTSNRDWASRYLLNNIDLFDVKNLDKKSFSRLQFFFIEDPWKLRRDHEAFFNTMRSAIEKRLTAAA